MKILGNPIGWLCNFGYHRTGFLPWECHRHPTELTLELARMYDFSYNSRVCVLKNLDEVNISGSSLYRIVPAEKTNGQSKDRSAERKSLGGHGN